MSPPTPRSDFSPLRLSGVTSALIVLFLAAYLPPGTFSLGTITLGLPRLILTLAFLPTLLILLIDRRYQLNAVDALVAAYGLWNCAALLANHGMAEIQFAGLQMVETVGAYAFGRVLLATPEAYRFFWRTFGAMMLLILPFALIEVRDGTNLLLRIFDPLLDIHDTPRDRNSIRLGLHRVYGNLEHSILFGIFWGLGLIHFLGVYRSKTVRTGMIAACLMMVGLSVSSGAYLVVMIQVVLLAWWVAVRGRWALLIGLAAIFYGAVELLSDRPALLAIASRLAFSEATAYWRLYIFEYGVQNVLANPVFGLGLRDWARPDWLSASIDNQWLLTAMRGGLPALLLHLAAIAVMIRILTRRRDLRPEVVRYRRNFLISFVGLMLALGTVAVWSGTQAFIWVLLAMGTGLAQSPATATSGAGPARRRQRLSFRRSEAELEANAVPLQRAGPGRRAVSTAAKLASP